MMKNILDRLFPTLGRKVAFSVVVILSITGSTFIFFAHTTGTSMLRKQAQAKAHAIAEFGKAIVEHIMMLEGKREHLQAALESAISSHQAKGVFILDSTGKVLLGASKSSQPGRIELDRLQEVPQWPGERFLSATEQGSRYEYVISPIINKPACHRCHGEQASTIGYFAAKLSMDDLRNLALEHRTVNAVMAIVLFLGIGTVIYLALVVLVLRPVGKLRSQMDRVEEEIDRFEQGGESSFSELAGEQRGDEIGSLLNAFNKLVHRLNEALKKVHALHQLQLEQADRLAATGEMAASIAHEIKNPLTGVQGALQVFEAEVTENDSRKEILREMITQLNRIDQAVNDLLSFARPGTPVFEAVNVNDVLDRTLSLLRPQFNGDKIEINLTLEPTIPLIQADRKLLQQLFWNIMLNGFQAIDSSGTLSVRTTPEAHTVTVSIHDTGKGITKGHLSKIFQPFFTTKHKGTGLGLAISKRIVEQHHGTLQVESEEGRGTTVTITLPCS